MQPGLVVCTGKDHPQAPKEGGLKALLHGVGKVRLPQDLLQGLAAGNATFMDDIRV